MSLLKRPALLMGTVAFAGLVTMLTGVYLAAGLPAALIVGGGAFLLLGLVADV